MRVKPYTPPAALTSHTRGNLVRFSGQSTTVDNYRHHNISQNKNITLRNYTSASGVAESKFTRRGGVIFSEKGGLAVIHDPLLNKSTGFTTSERDRLALRGLVPPRQTDLESQVQTVEKQYSMQQTDIQKYIFAMAVMDRNETLFYSWLIKHIEDLAPIVYTPTVGLACQKFTEHFRRPRGMYFSAEDRGNMASMVYNWPSQDVDVIVVTDGGRILGLGDLGANGMGIPIGKLSLYIAAGGIHPGRVLPVMLDVGTNNESLLQNPSYIGLPRKRLEGQEYYEVVDEFLSAVRGRWPNVLVQFEDFTSDRAHVVLDKYRHQELCFNDDIQGTGAVVLSGLLSALRAKGSTPQELPQQKILVMGAGCAAMGVCLQILNGMEREGVQSAIATQQFYVLDKDGLVTQERNEFGFGQETFARNDMPEGMSLMEVIKQVKPDIMLGLTGVGGIFTEQVVREMSQHVDRPIIFPLSNPTSQSECTAQQAFDWSEGKCIFASGSPFEPVKTNQGKTFYPSQGNNMYIFPGVGLGAILCRAKRVSNDMFYAASKALANCVDAEELSQGRVYPGITNIRNVSKHIAVEVIKTAVETNLAQQLPEENVTIEEFVENNMYSPKYQQIIFSGQI